WEGVRFPRFEAIRSSSARYRSSRSTPARASARAATLKENVMRRTITAFLALVLVAVSAGASPPNTTVTGRAIENGMVIFEDQAELLFIIKVGDEHRVGVCSPAVHGCAALDQLM